MFVTVGVWVIVGVSVGVFVTVGVSVTVGVKVGVFVDVCVGVLVGVFVAPPGVGVGVRVDRGVAVMQFKSPTCAMHVVTSPIVTRQSPDISHSKQDSTDCVPKKIDTQFVSPSWQSSYVTDPSPSQSA